MDQCAPPAPPSNGVAPSISKPPRSPVAGRSAIRHPRKVGQFMNDGHHEGLTRRGLLGGAAAAVAVASLPSGRASAASVPTPPDLARWHMQAAHVTITR